MLVCYIAEKQNCGVLVCVVGREFKRWYCRTKDYKIGICGFSGKHAALRSKSWFRFRIMCLSGVTCLPVNCCFSELSQ